MHGVERLHSTVLSFCQWLRRLPRKRWTVAEGEWGPQEVLAHLVFWHEYYVAAIRSFLAGQHAAPPEGSYNEVNARAVAILRQTPPAELLQRFREASERLIHIYRTHDPSAILIATREGAAPRSLIELVPEIEAHVHHHHQELRARQRQARRV